MIILDNLEYADNESFELFEALFESHAVFCVFAIGKRKRVLDNQREILKNIHVKEVRMKPIDFQYHKDLACNFLVVDALPLELERILHLKSNGNPGWIERFLVSLMQSGVLVVKEISLVEAIKKGFIFSDAICKGFDCFKDEFSEEWVDYSVSFY